MEKERLIVLPVDGSQNCDLEPKTGSIVAEVEALVQGVRVGPREPLCGAAHTSPYSGESSLVAVHGGQGSLAQINHIGLDSEKRLDLDVVTHPVLFFGVSTANVAEILSRCAWPLDNTPTASCSGAGYLGEKEPSSDTVQITFIL